MKKEQPLEFPYNFLSDIVKNYEEKCDDFPSDILGTTMYIISHLGRRAQEFVYGYYKEGKSYEQIGQRLGISRERVRQIRETIIRRASNDECQMILSVGIANYIICITNEKTKSEKNLTDNQITLAKLTDILKEAVRIVSEDKGEDIRRTMLIEELHLSNRSYNGLKREGVATVADILNLGDLRNVWCIGNKSAQEIENKIQDLGLNISRC